MNKTIKTTATAQAAKKRVRPPPGGAAAAAALPPPVVDLASGALALAPKAVTSLFTDLRKARPIFESELGAILKGEWGEPAAPAGGGAR